MKLQSRPVALGSYNVVPLLLLLDLVITIVYFHILKHRAACSPTPTHLVNRLHEQVATTPGSRDMVPSPDSMTTIAVLFEDQLRLNEHSFIRL